MNKANDRPEGEFTIIRHYDGQRGKYTNWLAYIIMGRNHSTTREASRKRGAAIRAEFKRRYGFLPKAVQNMRSNDSAPGRNVIWRAGPIPEADPTEESER